MLLGEGARRHNFDSSGVSVGVFFVDVACLNMRRTGQEKARWSATRAYHDRGTVCRNDAERFERGYADNGMCVLPSPSELKFDARALQGGRRAAPTLLGAETSMALMLIVEPEASLRTLIYEVLEQEGYVVIEAANSYEGLVAGDAAVPADITLEISYLVVF
jgi:hypothetical protein